MMLSVTQNSLSDLFFLFCTTAFVTEHNNSDVMEQDGRKRQISSDNYRSMGTKRTFHKYGNVIKSEERILIQDAGSQSSHLKHVGSREDPNQNLVPLETASKRITQKMPIQHSFASFPFTTMLYFGINLSQVIISIRFSKHTMPKISAFPR